jgi:hypothetical protein
MEIYTKIVYRFQVTAHEFNHILDALQDKGGERELALADELIRRRENFKEAFLRSFQMELRQRELDSTEMVSYNEKDEPVIVKKSASVRLRRKMPTIQ